MEYIDNIHSVPNKLARFKKIFGQAGITKHAGKQMGRKADMQ